MGLMKLVLAGVMVLGAGLSAFAFVAAPNFHQVLDQGAGWMVDRARDAPVEGVVFVLEPLLAAGQLVLAWALVNRGGRAVVVTASIVAALVVVGLLGLLALSVGSAAAGGAH
ncbi:MAG: hypothetical protein JNJ54_10345 [Myxococcaceae bacterium]|nr:hypothetical protein [Myxococcaceae bacterium]